ncbi:MAG TPA: aminotransferase class IV [Verrucomicrobiae bacterium]|nr:aminotransferase class IV [Verrucomicrobiae bacterium]
MASSCYAYVNGRFRPEAQASVSIFDRGFLYGDGVFETMRTYGGRLFRAVEHMDRLFEGLQALGIESVLSPEELRAVCRSLTEMNDIADGVARVYRTRDSIVVTVRPHELATRNLTALVSTVRIDSHLSQHKTANRLPYVLAQQQAAMEGADEAVLLNAAGRVVEFTTSNLFVVKDGQLYTPPLSEGPLPGITRHVVLMLAKEMGIPVNETGFGPEFLDSADEVFATNSLIEIAPVTNWGQPQEVTRQLQEGYQQLVAEELGLE